MPIKHLSWGMGGSRRLAGGVAAPTFVSATTNEAGTLVTVAFRKEMADPTGKHAQFTVNDGANNAVTAAALNATTTKIDLTLTNAIEYGDVVTVAYTKGTVESADGGVLASFSAQSVTNTVPEPVPDYQSWTNYPDTPSLTADYPYQCIVQNPTLNRQLFVSATPLYEENVAGTIRMRTNGENYVTGYECSGPYWTPWGVLSNDLSSNLSGNLFSNMEANNDVFTDSGLGTVLFAKTT